MRKWLLSVVVGCFCLVGIYVVLFTIPEKPVLISLDATNQRTDSSCSTNMAAASLDSDERIRLLVWNIYKQGREGWSEALNNFSANTDLVLLQEANLNTGLLKWLSKYRWASSHVSAFKYFDSSAGVMTLTPDFPLKACAYTQMEPWLRLPKSALYSTYPLSNGQTLAVVNIHAVNFTIGTTEFEAQIDALKAVVESHAGPMIIAGDFNTWSEERTLKLNERMTALEMVEAKFSPDSRFEFITGWPLDHVYYRGLVLETAETPISDASDHNPMQVTFRLIKGSNADEHGKEQ
ncbi:endonuclease/exonuclease/phosphatase family protein [Vibrio sp. S9_S30]|uniref:endonuclease/exonuclease/phosphatase family protein n=1 Tax=Vibrio sp. S9_S30 TaxID=2720226 RepID=UPI0016811E5F|nr:endonuclease/exonuclease/phosphatase family protein [Vibrio sp. S9_S30]MBD1555981.1 endonuclease/exonuclease/phosphatase family protein [Vibrio sp. S9_S30]